MSDPVPPTPAPTPAPVPWKAYLVGGLVVVGVACLVAAGMLIEFFITGGQLPVPTPPQPVVLSVPERAEVGKQFIVSSRTLGPVTWLEHGMDGLYGHAGAETQNPDKTFSSSYAVTLGRKACFPIGAAIVQDDKIVQKWYRVDATDPTPPVPPTPPPVSPLTQALQNGYSLDMDADKAKSLGFLQAIYVAMAASPPSPPPATNRDALDWIRGKIEVPAIGLSMTQVVNLRRTIATEMAAELGTVPSAPLDAAKFTTALNNVANALKGVR